MTLTKVLGFSLVVGAVLGITWTTAPWPALVISGFVLVVGVVLVAGAEYFERTHPELFPKTPKEG